MLKYFLGIVGFLATGLSASAQIDQTLNNLDWNAATWGSPPAPPSAGNSYATVQGVGNFGLDPIGVGYYGTLRVNDVPGTSTFAGGSLTIAGNTRLLLKQASGDSASANLILANNSNVILATGLAGPVTLAGAIQVPQGATAYLGVNNFTNSSLTVTSTLSGSGTLELGLAGYPNEETINLVGNMSSFGGTIVIYTPGNFTIGTNAAMPNANIAITNTSCTFVLNNVIAINALTVGTVNVPTGAYTAPQLNTATGTSIFTGPGSLIVGGTLPGFASVTDGRVTVSMNPLGNYQVKSSITGWTFGGTLPSPLTQISTTSGTDSVGAYQQIAFAWLDSSSRQMTGSINLYTGQDCVIFSDTLVAASASGPSAFPNFTTLPQNLYAFSFANGMFAPPSFSVWGGSEPWMFFDSNANAVIISPASHFIPATLSGDGSSQIASGFSSSLVNAPAGFTQKTLVSISSGINHAFNIWGQALANLYGKTRPANDVDALLRYYGYWTDNGAAYYYSYIQNASAPGESAYEATLQNVIADFVGKGIPVHYVQLDSWWYDKSDVSYDGSAAGYRSGAPQQPWALTGGELNWAADANLFPNGLAAYSHALGTTEFGSTSTTSVPFVCHARWIDTTAADASASTFYSEFGGYGTDFTGIAGISSRFWNSLAAYAQASQVQVYEQDWLTQIVGNSPGLTSTVDQGDAFLGNMSAAFAAQNINIQYCLANSSCLMQACEYSNVTTSRVSFDRFQPGDYHNFLYTSRLASAVGVWPWSDVFMSTEPGNLLLSNLSAGPVGTGDSLGSENITNLFLALRGDGVIVKPDQPVVPTDGSYLAEARNTGAPLIASTTSNNGVTTTYAIAIPHSSTSTSNYTLSLPDVGVASLAYVYDYFAQTGTQVQPGGAVSGPIATGGVSYFIIAPVGQSGIAFLGDLGKFVSNGKKRIKWVMDQPGQLAADVLFAPTETQVTLHGYSSVQPSVAVQGGQAGAVAYAPLSDHFTVAITPSSATPLNNDIDPAREVIVTFTNVPTAPAIVSAPPTANGTVDTTYAFTFHATGYPAATFSLASGSLPPGLTLTPYGLLSGSPTDGSAGVYLATVSASNGVGAAVSQTFTITISGAADTPTLPTWGLLVLGGALLAAGLRRGAYFFSDRDSVSSAKP